MKYLYLFLLLLGCNTAKKPVNDGSKTLVSFKTIATTPKELVESSGLTVIDRKLYTHNDSGNETVLFELDTLGKLQNSTSLSYLNLRDWEAVTSDDQFIYLGDFGNNRGDRKDLAIYKIALNTLATPLPPFERLLINYTAQQDFTPRNQQHEYDLESMISIQDSIYLFSKDWSTLQTSIYKLDKKAGPHPLQSTATLPVRSLVTDATFNGANRVVLTSYDRGLQPYIIILQYDRGTFTLKERIPLPVESSQIEAITYYGTQDGIETYYLTSEAVNIKLGDIEANSDGAFYELKLKANQ